jgi:hypothetical protein
VDRGIGGEDLVDPAGRGRRTRRLAEEHAGHPQRPDEHEDVGVERDDRAELDLSLQHQRAAVAENGDEPHRGQQVDERQEPGSKPGGFERAVEDPVGAVVELGRLDRLGPEALHDPDAGERLLHHARELGELLLQVEAHRLHPLGEERGRDVEERQRAQREQCQQRAREHDDRDHRDEHQRARHREREQDDDGVHLLDVGIGPGHELPGLGLVVEREVQPLQVREELLAHVGLDPERHAERAVSAEPGGDGLHDAEREDDPHVLHGRAHIVLQDPLVDGDPRHQRDAHTCRGPEGSGAHTEHRPAPMGPDGAAHEPPSFSSRRALGIHPSLSRRPATAAWAREPDVSVIP